MSSYLPTVADFVAFSRSRNLLLAVLIADVRLDHFYRIQRLEISAFYIDSYMRYLSFAVKGGTFCCYLIFLYD